MAQLEPKKISALAEEQRLALLVALRGYGLYTARLIQPNPVFLASGLLEVGKKYKIVDWYENDDFSNVGASDNQPGIIFIATGTTPSSWSNNSKLIDLAASSIVADVLENSIGINVYFEYYEIGRSIAILQGIAYDKVYIPNPDFSEMQETLQGYYTYNLGDDGNGNCKIMFQQCDLNGGLS